MTPPPDKGGSVIRLLVVDDSALMRKLLGIVFAAEGDFEVAFARNGAEALDHVKQFKPHVVTLDVHMPVMNGLECLSRLMVEAPVPVVMLSARTREGAEETLEAMSLGAVGFVAKPDGTPSLTIDELRPTLVSTVRAAAGARLRGTLRLRDRVRHQIERAGTAPTGQPFVRPPRPSVPPASLEDLPEGGTVGGLVLVGASTGGPQGLETILSEIPRDFPWPVVVAQHMPAAFTGVFARRIDRLCELSVVEVETPMPLRAGFVYIARGDADLVIAPRARGPIALPVPSSPGYRWHPSVDRLVDSALACIAPERLVGVLITGMGDDGAASMARIREGGGRTIAEDASTAVVWGMPGELVKAGGASMVLSLRDIAPALTRMLDAKCR